jgi:PAS domain S-box-containing protein
MALAGVALEELLLALHIRLLSPLTLPGVGMLAGAMAAGTPGLAGGAAIFAAYHLANFASPERFPHFFADSTYGIAATIGFAAIAGAIVFLRPRLLRMAAAEAELAAHAVYEQALRESAGRLRTISDNLPSFVAYVDAGERYRFANRVYEEWLGVTRSQMLGRTVREVWGEERYRQFEHAIARALRGERVSYSYVVKREGAEQNVEATYIPDVDVRGAIKGLFILASAVVPGALPGERR